MTESIKEQLSAFLDNELPKPELELLLKRLGTDEELRSSLERYVLIGESLRAAPHAQVSRTFSARVRAAVEQEANQNPPSPQTQTPASQAPQTPRTPQNLPQNLPQSSPQSLPQSLPARWSKPLMGFAVAAGAAAGAVLMVRLAPLDWSDPAGKDNPRSQTELARNVVVPAPQVQPAPQAASDSELYADGRRWRTVPAFSATQLTHYVVAHSEYSSPLERRNVLTGVLGEAQPVNDVIEIESER